MPPRDLDFYPEPQTPVVPVDEDGRILLRAADLLEQRGWWRIGDGHPQSGVCLMLAIYEAVGRDRDRADRMLPRLGFKTAEEAFWWNDRQESVAPIFARLRSAAHAVPE